MAGRWATAAERAQRARAARLARPAPGGGNSRGAAGRASPWLARSANATGWEPLQGKHALDGLSGMGPRLFSAKKALAAASGRAGLGMEAMSGDGMKGRERKNRQGAGSCGAAGQDSAAENWHAGPGWRRNWLAGMAVSLARRGHGMRGSEGERGALWLGGGGGAAGQRGLEGLAARFWRACRAGGAPPRARGELAGAEAGRAGKAAPRVGLARLEPKAWGHKAWKVLPGMIWARAGGRRAAEFTQSFGRVGRERGSQKLATACLYSGKKGG
jgi:hypothetical protein